MPPTVSRLSHRRFLFVLPSNFPPRRHSIRTFLSSFVSIQFDFNPIKYIIATRPANYIFTHSHIPPCTENRCFNFLCYIIIIITCSFMFYFPSFRAHVCVDIRARLCSNGVPCVHSWVFVFFSYHCSRASSLWCVCVCICNKSNSINRDWCIASNSNHEYFQSWLKSFNSEVKYSPNSKKSACRIVVLCVLQRKGGREKCDVCEQRCLLYCSM